MWFHFNINHLVKNSVENINLFSTGVDIVLESLQRCAHCYYKIRCETNDSGRAFCASVFPFCCLCCDSGHFEAE